MILHGYYRSAASWRVRIALHLKDVAAQQIPHHLRRGEQRSAAYLALNPQGLVPTLELDDGRAAVERLPRRLEREAACLAMSAFSETAPERQPDAE